MATDDFFRARLDSMIDLRHPLAVLAGRLPWSAVEAALSAKFAHQELTTKSEGIDGLFGAETVEFGGGRAGRPRLPIRLMAGLLYPKNSFNLSDEELGLITHKSGLMVGARSFIGNPYDGHTLAEQLEQVRNLCQDIGVQPKTVVVDLGYRGVDEHNPGVQIIHRGKFKSLTTLQRRWLKRRQAIEPAIGHMKADHRMDRCWLQGQTGDALDALSCALGYNIRWLMRALQAKARRVMSWLLQMVSVGAKHAAIRLVEQVQRLLSPVMHWLGGLVTNRQLPVSRLPSA